jgi:hypothetical protein
MLERFAVPDWGIDEIIAADPETYISQWKELMKDSDCVIAIQRRKANAIARAMFSQGFTNERVWKAYNIARVVCGLPEREMPVKQGGVEQSAPPENLPGKYADDNPASTA